MRSASGTGRSDPSRRARRRRLLLLILILAVGVVTRLPRIDEPPADYHPNRQYFSALTARDWLAAVDADLVDVPPDVAGRARDRVIEPPVMEAVSVVGFVATGGQSWWLPRLLGTVLWAAFAGVVGCLGFRLRGPTAGLCAGAVVALGPATTEAGRSFQPEALTLLATAVAVLALLRLEDDPAAGRRQLAAGLAVGSAAALKLTAGVVLLPVVALTVLRRRHDLGGLGLARIALPAVLPALAYYGYGLFVADFLEGQGGGRVLPSLWDDAWYWEGWWRVLQDVTPPWLLVAAALGLLAAPVALRRTILALLAGTALLGLTFTYHAASHSYYSLPLLLPAALAVGSGVAWLADRSRGRWGRAAVVVAVGGLGLAGAALQLADAADAPTAAAQPEVQAVREVGALLPVGTHVVAVDQRYGYLLRYHAGLVTEAWPNVYDLGLLRLEGEEQPDAGDVLERAARRGARYVVVTDLLEPVRQPRLRALLRDLQLVGIGERWNVYALPAPTTSAAGSIPSSGAR